MRASILAATSLHSLVRDSSWGVVRPLSSCGVSEQEKDLRWLLWARQTVAYCTMLSSRGKHTEGWRSAREVTKQQKRFQLSLFTNVFWGSQKMATVLNKFYNPKAGIGNRHGAVTDRRPGCGWAGESSSHCWTCAGLNRVYTDIWLSWISPWWRCSSSCWLGSLLQIYASAGTWRKHLLHTEKKPTFFFWQEFDLNFTRWKELNDKTITPLTLEEIVAVSLQ